MGVVFNTMVKNESIMLDNILPIWDKYPIDYFIFYDDKKEEPRAAADGFVSADGLAATGL
jgi:hypothetical protein